MIQKARVIPEKMGRVICRENNAEWQAVEVKDRQEGQLVYML